MQSAKVASEAEEPRKEVSCWKRFWCAGCYGNSLDVRSICGKYASVVCPKGTIHLSIFIDTFVIGRDLRCLLSFLFVLLDVLSSLQHRKFPILHSHLIRRVYFIVF